MTTKFIDKQVGGDHYKRMKIQPSVYCEENSFTHLQSQVIKYVSRWNPNVPEANGKYGLQDLQKAEHCLAMIKEIYGYEGDES